MGATGLAAFRCRRHNPSTEGVLATAAERPLAKPSVADVRALPVAMLPIDALPPPGFAWKAISWLGIVAGWAVATIWVDRDARANFGRSQPWKYIFLAIGLALFAGLFEWGIRAAIPAAVCLLLSVGLYSSLRRAAGPMRIPAGPLGAALRMLAFVARSIGMSPESAAALFGFGKRPDRKEEVVLLKKGGGVYGGSDAKRLDRETSAAVRTVKEVLGDAVSARATDVHVEPREDQEMRLRFRIDGMLHAQRTLASDLGRALISAIKVLGDLDIAERRRPQDGSFAIITGGRRFDIRVNTGPTGYGEKASLRLLDPSGGVLREGLGALGMREMTLQSLRSVVHRSHGMLIVCGPTGSGKTTTVYAALSEIDSLIRNIVTIEDPIEYQLKNVSQTAVNNAADLGFAAILRAVLRQDPDVILVGEVRDKETAEIAMQAALTGHFVFTTLHANDAASTVTRLLDIGIDVSLIQTAVTAVLAQRLVRLLCTDCREKYEPSTADLRRFGMPADKVRRLYRPKGCHACSNTGYRGRTGVYELLLVDSEIRSLLVGRPSLEVIRQAAARQGMKTMRRMAVYKAAEGLTSLDEVDRVVPDEGFTAGGSSL
jgi:type II secretory ATPase GspE/PulE/Tfp pilus assembly ATPase PilB-like protein